MYPTKTIVLDRDGVINQDSDAYVKTCEELIPVTGSLEAIRALHQCGYRVIIATNQSGLGRGLFDQYSLAKIHNKLCSMVEDAGGMILGIFYCPHLPDFGCNCRKPNTGLLVQAEMEFGISLKGCHFVGDSLKDIQAALAFDMLPILVRTGKGKITEQTLTKGNFPVIPVYDDLHSVAESLTHKKG